MENLEKLKSWVDRKIPQRQEKLADYVNFVQEKVGEFIVDFPNIDSVEATNSHINFANDLSNINRDRDEILALTRLRSNIADAADSEELLKRLSSQVQTNLEQDMAFLESIDFTNITADISNVEFDEWLSQINFSVIYTKTLIRAIYILEGET